MLAKTLVSAALLVTAAPAQRDMGPLIASQVIATVRPGTRSGSTPLSTRELHTKKAGFRNLQRAGTTSGPDLSFRALFPDPRQLDGKAAIEVDALSNGEDFIWANASGEIRPTGSQWVALTFSVRGGGSGGTATGAIAAEEGRPDGAGADLFTFCVGALPTPLTGITRRAIDSTEINMFAPGFPGDINAIDLQLAAYTLDAGITSALDTNPYVYFSVDSATVAAVPPSWWGTSIPSAATILRTQWTGTAWTTPQPFATYSDLWLSVNDDLDAVAIQCFSTYVDIVFSTTMLTPVATSQLMFVRLNGIGCGEVPPAPVKTADGAPVADQLGNGTGDIDAICLHDPSILQPGSTSDVWAYVTGTPLPALPLGAGTPRTLEASAWRTCPGSAVSISSYVTGWVGGTPSPDTLFYVLGIGAVGAPPASYHLLGNFSRAGTEPGGGPVSVDIPLPPGWGRSGLIYVDHIWIGANATTQAQAFPVRIRL